MKLYLVDPLDNANAKLNLLLALLPSPDLQIVPCDRKTTFEKQALRANPLLAFPALETDEGTVSGILPIAAYLCEETSSSLMGSDSFSKCKVLQFLNWASQAASCLRGLALHTLGIKPLTPQQIAPLQKELGSMLKRVQALLVFSTFLMGDELTFADISLICDSHVVLGQQAGLQKEFPGVWRWRQLVLSLAPVRSVLRK